MLVHNWDKYYSKNINRYYDVDSVAKDVGEISIPELPDIDDYFTSFCLEDNEKVAVMRKHCDHLTHLYQRWVDVYTDIAQALESAEEKIDSLEAELSGKVDEIEVLQKQLSEYA